jgi:hypothetical protein
MEGAILLERAARHLFAFTSLLQHFLPLASVLNEHYSLHSDVYGKRSVDLNAHRIKSHLLPSDDNISCYTTSNLHSCAWSTNPDLRFRNERKSNQRHYFPYESLSSKCPLPRHYRGQPSWHRQG